MPTVSPAPIPPRRAAWNALLDLVYPVRCVCCDRIGSGCLCDSCTASVGPVSPPFCPRCAEPGETGLCPGCRSRNPAFDLARSSGLFEDPLRRAIHALKYERKERLAEPLSELLYRTWRGEERLRSAEAVVPMPIHRKREGSRGFNQSALLAREFVLRSGLPLLEDTLSRPHYRRPQVGLGAAERRSNVEGVFGVDQPESVRGKALLLIDDVITTGATCHEAARTLREAGARAVLVLALAREPYRR